MLISVVIPLYNAKKYIGRCLDALLNQTHKNMEIIVVDDCSSDNSVSVVEEYIKKYDNIILIKNNENRKTFETKRIGMENANGDYIGFCDADDWHETNAYEYMLNRMQENDYDMVTVDLIQNDNNWNFLGNIKEHSYNNGELYTNLISLKEQYPMQVSLFKKEVIKNALKNINHYINFSHAEDFLWEVIIYFYVKKSLHTDNKLYNYYKNEESTSRSNDYNTIINRVIDYSIMLEELKNILSIQNDFNNVSNLYLSICSKHARISFNALKNCVEDCTYIWLKEASKNLKKGLIFYFEMEINKSKKEIDKFKKEIDIYRKELTTYSVINTKLNIFDFIFSIEWDNNYFFLIIFGIKLTFKKKHKK